MDETQRKLAEVSKNICTKDKWSPGSTDSATLKGDSVKINIKLGKETQNWDRSIQHCEKENLIECIQNEGKQQKISSSIDLRTFFTQKRDIVITH